jgi:hypothetical protein
MWMTYLTATNILFGFSSSKVVLAGAVFGLIINEKRYKEVKEEEGNKRDYLSQLQSQQFCVLCKLNNNGFSRAFFTTVTTNSNPATREKLEYLTCRFHSESVTNDYVSTTFGLRRFAHTKKEIIAKEIMKKEIIEL